MYRGVKRGWGPISPGLLSAYAPQSSSDRSARLGFQHRVGRCRPGITQFASPGRPSNKRYGRMSEPRMLRNHPRVRRYWRGSNGDGSLVWREGQTVMGPYRQRVAIGLRVPAIQRSARAIGVSTLCGTAWTRGNSIFFPGVSEL